MKYTYMKKVIKKERINAQKGRARAGHLKPCEVPPKEIKELACSALFDFHDNLKSCFPVANLAQILNPPQWRK